MSKQRILFVDDEPRVLDGLRRMLHPMRQEWEMAFAGSGLEALQQLDGAPFDVLVTDIRMPGMDGAGLLAEVLKRHPQTVRLVLSGHSDHDVALRALAMAHQCLSKPCDPVVLKTAIHRASTLRHLLAEPSLKRIVSSMTSLPSIPSVYLELMEALQAPDPSIQDVARIIAKDTAMTAKVLQLANSAFFGAQRRFANLKDAVLYLGSDTVKALVLATGVFSQFDTALCSAFSLEALSRHSLAAGAWARRIAESEQASQRLIDHALLGGLMHDVGKLVFASGLPAQYDSSVRLARAKGVPHLQIERETFGATHAEVGAYLLLLWGMGDELVEAIAFHHTPSACPVRIFSPLTAVHVADSLEHEAGGVAPEMAGELDTGYLTETGLDHRLAHWRELGRPGGGEA